MINPNSFLLIKGGPLILITILLKKLGGEVTITPEDVDDISGSIVLETPSETGFEAITFSVVGEQHDA